MKNMFKVNNNGNVDLMLVANFISMLIYTVSNNFLNPWMLHEISPVMMTISNLGTCLITGLISMISGKSDKFIKFCYKNMKLTMVIETVLYISFVPLFFIFEEQFYRIFMFFTTNVIYCTITTLTITGGREMNSILYTSEERSKKDSLSQGLMNIATFISSAGVLLYSYLISDFNESNPLVMVIIMGIGCISDNILYFKVYNICESKKTAA